MLNDTRSETMDVMKSLILVSSPRLAFVEPALADRYNVVRLWENPADDVLADVRAVTCLGHESLDRLLDRLPSLGLIACFTTGYDGIDVKAAQARGIAITHAPGATAHSVAEFALALTLAASRKIVAGDRMVLSGQWKPDSLLMGRSLLDMRLGIVGLGAVGTALATMSEALGMKVAWWGPRMKRDVRWTYTASLHKLAQDSDVLAICAPADNTNLGMISAEVIGALGPYGLLVNVGRGQLVDEIALIAALRSGRLGGAALDVFETEPTPSSRWVDVPNLITTPHIGGATTDTARRMVAMLMDNLDRFFAGRDLATPIPSE